MSGWLTKKRLFAFHGWLGLTLGLPLFIICLAGACAVMAPELDRVLHPEMRVASPADQAAKPLPWGALLEKVEAACPEGEVGLMDAADERTEAWTAVVNYSPRDSRLVLFDPYTGKVKGQRTHFNARSFFRIFHKQFYIVDGKYWPHGRLIVCSFSIVLLLAAVTGLMFYAGWWKHLYRMRVGKGLRIFLSDLHRFVGVWTFLLAMLFAVTGLWYLTERVMEDMGVAEHEPSPKVSESVRAARAPNVKPLSLDELIARANEAVPGMRIKTILFGNQAGGVVGLWGEGEGLVENRSSKVYLDPHTGEVVALKTADGMTFGARLEGLVNPLHFGRFGGLFTKIIWAVAGFALAVGILAGAYIRWMRTRRMEGGASRSATAWSRVSLVLNLMILGLAGVSTVGFIRNQIEGPMNPDSRVRIGESQAGPWQVEAFRLQRKGKPDAGMAFHFVSEGEPNFRAAYAWSGSEAKPEGLKPLKGSRNVLFASGPKVGGPIHLGIEAWDGTLHVTSFPAGGWEIGAAVAPPAALGVSRVLWLVVGAFFTAVLAPAALWLIRLR